MSSNREADLLNGLTEESLHEAIIDSLEPSQENFRIDSLEAFTWYMNKLELLASRIRSHQQLADRKLEALNALVQRERDRILADAERETTPYKAAIRHLVYRYQPQAVAFSDTHLAALGKVRSFKIGAAQIGRHRSPDKIKVLNKNLVAQWALEHNQYDQLIRTEEAVNHAELSKYIKDTGEIVPGTGLVPGNDEFYVKIQGQNLRDVVGDELFRHEDPSNE